MNWILMIISNCIPFLTSFQCKNGVGRYTDSLKRIWYLLKSAGATAYNHQKGIAYT